MKRAMKIAGTSRPVDACSRRNHLCADRYRVGYWVLGLLRVLSSAMKTVRPSLVPV